MLPLTAVIQPVSMLRPVSTKNGCPAVKFEPDATEAVVAPIAVAAESVDMPAAGTPLAFMNDVLAPVYASTGVSRTDAAVVDRYGFSRTLESIAPPTLKPGMPWLQNGDAASSVDLIIASTSVPAACTGEYVA